MASLTAVSLFSNCGAGDVGYRSAGFRFKVLAELLDYRLTVAKLNHPRARTVPGDLRITLPEVIAEWGKVAGDGAPALLAACPPCQGMSSANGDRGRDLDAEAGSADPRNLLVEVVADAATELRPRAVVVENVPAFLTRRVLDPTTGNAVSAAVLLIDRLASDYLCYPLVTDLADHGVPQRRRRAFLTFLRRDETATALLNELGGVPYPAPATPDAPWTISAALGSWGLPELDASSAMRACSGDHPLHTVPVWNESRYRMVRAIPVGNGGTAWDNSRCVDCGEDGGDTDTAICSGCGSTLPRPTMADPDGSIRLISGFRRSSYRRMHPDRPASTITTASGRIGSDNTLHPTEHRVLSVLECQLLQTFPLDFRWGDALAKKGHTGVREMIGEAVPPHFTRQHGRVLAALLSGRRPYRLMSGEDRRVSNATALLTKARLHHGEAAPGPGSPSPSVRAQLPVTPS